MATEATTIARPYAEAAFQRALETESLELWSEMLSLLSGVAQDSLMAGLIDSPKLERPKMLELILEIGGGRLNEEGQNFVRLLVENQRLSVLPEISELFEEQKTQYEGMLDVLVYSAFEIKPAQQQALEKALKEKLGREIKITSEKDPELIGGIRIKAGDMVIDGSIQGQLRQLADDLAI